ncbi:MAG TPA: glycosyltransferase family A protein, partial [Bacteroidia bacterium]|nr:glycosyltransferase family A protein [Bacteroidia bacterium]
MTPSTEALPYFSIVIPSYNRIRFLPETIDSILKQTCQDFEILVVDDGSTDHTPEIIRNRYNQFPNLRLIEQVNSERGTARNNGFRLAKGKYVIFIDSDDMMLPEHLETLKAYIDQLKQPRFIATKFLFLRNGKTR